MKMNMHSYPVMFIIMMISGILSSMNIWADSISDISLSLNDIYMSLLMSGWMILFMAILEMNIPVIFISILIIVITFIAIRKQLFINENQYLRGMIPHHSMAITMSKKLQDNDPNNRIPQLLNSIIKTQRNEIEYMKKILKM
jgi:hypothetical protein